MQAEKRYQQRCTLSNRLQVRTIVPNLRYLRLGARSFIAQSGALLLDSVRERERRGYCSSEKLLTWKPRSPVCPSSYQRAEEAKFPFGQGISRGTRSHSAHWSGGAPRETTLKISLAQFSRDARLG
ncbi:unnamed protein product [Ectocarpus sp. 12 AP-2014]